MEDLKFFICKSIEFKILLIKFVVMIKSIVIVFVFFNFWEIFIFIVVVIDLGNRVIIVFLE